MGNLWANGKCPLDWPHRFRDDVVAEGPLVDNHVERTNDPAKAVHVVRQQGMTGSFPVQTAEGDIIFEVGEGYLNFLNVKDWTSRPELARAVNQ